MNDTCCVIGQTQLAIDCSKLLLKRGIIIQLIFTDDLDFKEWADCLKIDVKDTDSLQCLMKEASSDFGQFDYLFSIVNDVIIPTGVLSVIRKLSINYHNGPLPKYRGANATNWALLSGEKSHGVVWHKITKKVDSGEILVRKKVVIDPSDNLQTLNWKCWEAAKESFGELCHNLPYMCDHHSMKKMHDKPSAFCILPFDRTAQEVYNFVRGTCHLNSEGETTSTLPNELGLPKLFVSNLNKLFVITGINVLKEALIPNSIPGSVVSIADHLRVSTLDYDVMITDLLTIDGVVVSKPFIESLSLKIGTVVNIQESNTEDSYIWKLSRYSLAGRHEKKWIRGLNHQWLSVPVLRWPYSMQFNAACEMDTDPCNDNFVLCNIENILFSKHSLPHQPEVLVLASIIYYLLLLTPSLSGSVDIRLNRISRNPLCIQSILNSVSASFQLSEKVSFIETINQFGRKLSSDIYGEMESDVRVRTVASDVFLRYSLEPVKNEILVGIAEEGETLMSALNSKRVAIFCSKKEHSVDINLVTPNYPINSLQTFKHNFLSFLNHALTNSNATPIAQQVTLCSKEINIRLHDSPVLNGLKSNESFPTWFHRSFEESANKFPFGVAVIDEIGQYTYRELNQKAEAIACTILEKMNRTQFGRVAILLDRTWLSLAAIIASLKLGFTYIPLEKESPVLFNCQILEDAKPDLLLVDDSDHWVQNWYEYAVCTCNFSVISLHDIPQFSIPVHQKVESPPAKAAVLLYTSGTTGKPKGILINHKGLCNVINCVVRRMHIQPCDLEATTVEYSLYDASPTFDTCFLQVFPILWNGGTVIIVPTDPSKPCKNHSLFYHVTFLSTTPRKLFLYKAEQFRCARNVAVGGEDPSMELYKKWERANRTLWNLYGPAEISVITTMGIIKDQVHLGEAIDNSTLRILNPLQTAVPIGIPGELYILGVGVAEGYTCDKITKEVFGIDLESGLRWYRSGDLVILDHSGVLKYIGRIPSDTQVKIGGKRVEPLGVEYALKTLPGIEYAEVIVESPARNINLLVAYVAPESVNVDDLNSKLKLILPEHMLPSHIIPVDLRDAKLSRTGKLRLNKTKYRQKLSHKFQPAHTELEKELLVNYRELLGIADNNIFGMQDSFRAFGGDSVIAVTLADKIYSLFGLKVKPIELLNFTPAEILAKQSPEIKCLKYFSAITADKENEVKVLHNQGVEQDSLELSGMQQSLLQMYTTEVGASYNIPLVFQIIGSFDIFHLTTAIEVALSCFSHCKEYNSSALPIVSDVDLSNNFHSAKDHALAMIQRDSFTPLDLKTSTYRCKMYHLSSTHCILSLLVHHIAFDYQSWNVLQCCIEKSYTTECLPSTMHENDSWSKFVQSEHTEYAKRKDEVCQFWHERLNGYPCFIPFPTSFPRSNLCYHRGKREVQKCNTKCYSRLLNICLNLDIQPVCFLLSTFALLIHHLSQQDKFCIATLCSRRANAEHKNAVGFVANTLVCNFTSTILESSFRELLQYTQSWHDEALKQGCIPFSELVKIWGYKSQQPNHFPQFILNCISDFKPHTLHLGEDISVTPITVDTYTAKAELLLDVLLSENDFSLIWEYDTHLFTDEAIKHCISNAYLTLLYQNVKNLGFNFDDCYIYPSVEQPINQHLIECRLSDCKIVGSGDRPNTCKLSSYQRAMLRCIVQTPQPYWGCFNCICSFEISPTIPKSDVQCAIKKVVEKNLYLQHVVSPNNECLKMKHSGLDLCYETVLNENEAESIRYRELLWPFNIWTGPLLHCTLVHDKSANTSKVMISASLILLDEQSLNLFCKIVHDTILTGKTLSLDSSLLPACFSQSQAVTNAEIECFKQVTNSLPHLSVQPQSLLEVVQNYVVTNATVDILNFTLPEQVPAFACAIAAALLWSVKKSVKVQLCFLYQCGLTTQHFCSSERLLPFELEVKRDIYFSKIMNDALKELQNQCLDDYWTLQNSFDPYSDYLHPHHEFLVQVVNSDYYHHKVQTIRPFSLHLQFCAEKKEIALVSTLIPQQTSVLFHTFKSIIKFFQTSQSTNVTIEKLLCNVPLSPSIAQGSHIKMDKADLCEVIIASLTEKKNTISHTCNVGGRMMVMTYGELYKQGVSLSISLQCTLIKKQSAKRCVVIIVEGGFALPVSIIAAVLGKITFTIIDPNETYTTIVEMISVIKPAIIMYDIHQFNVVEKLVGQKQFSDVMPILVDVFAEYNTMLSYEIKKPLPDNECAYIVFTSGSTGIPKAAPISGKAFCNFLAWHKTMFPSGNPLNWLQLSSLSFDICIAEMIGQLYCGNTIFLINLQQKLELDSYIFRVMSMFNIEGIHVVPTYLSCMLRQLDLTKEHFPSLRHIVSTGEKLCKQICKTVFKNLKLVCLHNWGGPSECCVEVLHCILKPKECIQDIPVGTPVNNCTVKIICPLTLETVPRLMPGEVIVSGIPVFDGYIQQHQLNPLVDILGQIYYRTGDIGYMNNKGHVMFLYRMNSLRKISGHSVDLEGIRTQIRQLYIPGVIDVIVDIVDDSNVELICFPVVSSANANVVEQIQCILASELPKRYVPRVVKCLIQDDVPLLRSGKINYKALREMARGMFHDRALSYKESCNLSDVFYNVLTAVVSSCSDLNSPRKTALTLDALGVSSIQKVHIYERLKKCGVKLEIRTLFLGYTLGDIVNKLNTLESAQQESRSQSSNQNNSPVVDQVAIINMQVNVPGAVSCNELWNMIISCKEEISHNLDESHTDKNIDNGNEKSLHMHMYVGSRGLIKNKSMFDANLFNLPPIEARVLDPQQRILLHMVWTALEEIGYAPDKLPAGKRIGCFAGAHFPHYMFECFKHETELDRDFIIWHNLTDNVSLRIGRTLNFRGPCITIANNCATFGAALHYARKSLIAEECDIAVVAAGSVYPEERGYYYKECDIYSKDGHCRPFSERATGTVMSDGLTVAILKRLHDAVQDGDEILCVMKGSAVGTDGKLGGSTTFVPSDQGQAETLKRAFRAADVDPSSIHLIEAHGTGTRTGDCVELASLTSVFENSARTSDNKCVLGSIKGNIGHAGVAATGPSIMKAAFALKNAVLPPTLHCEDPIPPLKDSKCFKVITSSIPWPETPLHNRRALVHSIGAMGTNCAIILEEYKKTVVNKLSQIAPENRPAYYPICVSAKTSKVLNKICCSIKQHVQEMFNSGILHILRDTSYTLIVGKTDLPV